APACRYPQWERRFRREAGSSVYHETLEGYHIRRPTDLSIARAAHESVPKFMSDVPSIRIAGIHKSFGSLEVLRGVSFDVPRGSVVSVIGASGSGKSTLLRCVNYLDPPNAGEVYIEGQPLGARIDARGNRKARTLAEINTMRRELGVVFQQF